MSDLPPASSPDETPAQPISAVQKKKNLYRRITTSMPLLVTVIVHIVFIGVAAAVVVQQSSGAKKKTFEASAQNTAADKQVEHRLQVARRGGASSSSSSPVSANRIFSTDANALQMPAMPDLPSLGSGGFGGFGSLGSGVGMGAGNGMSTSLGGGTGLGGRGFMSLSFLGSTTQNVSNVVFVVDTSTAIMEPRKGGFRAFSIIRDEIMRLVGRLPPSAKFNVVLFRNSTGDQNGVDVNLFQTELIPATSENKKDFFAWMSPVNAKLNSFGPNSALSRTRWNPKPIPPEVGLDPYLYPPVWARAAHVALEQQPDTIFVITASPGDVRRGADEATLAKRRAESDKRIAEFEEELKKLDLNFEDVTRARDRAYAKARAELDAANRKLVAAGKDPIVARGNYQIFDRETQAELKKNGITITLDTTGWSDAQGNPLKYPTRYTQSWESAPWNDFHAHFARLQKLFCPERATLNLFLFVGPNDRPDAAIADLTSVAKRNGGTFQLLTTKRLEELKAREEAPQ
jgi:hypothetical protein